MGTLAERRTRVGALALAAALAAAPGCTYLNSRGRDALDMIYVGFTFTNTPQFGLYGT